MNNNDLIAIPSVRRLAKENGVDLSKVKLTGKSNRIPKEDLWNYIKQQKSVDHKTAQRLWNDSYPKSLWVIRDSRVQG